MQVVPFHDAHDRLALLIDQAVTEGTATLIVRHGGGNAVLMSESAYNGMQETLYLLSSPANAARLLETIALDRKMQKAEQEG